MLKRSRQHKGLFLATILLSVAVLGIGVQSTFVLAHQSQLGTVPGKSSKESLVAHGLGDIEVDMPTKEGLRKGYSDQIYNSVNLFGDAKPNPLLEQLIEEKLDRYIQDEVYFLTSAPQNKHSVPIINRFIKLEAKPDGAIEFARYVRQIEPDIITLRSKKPSDFPQGFYFKPTYIVLHNTAEPRLKDRPNGFSSQNMADLATYYGSPDPSRHKPAWYSGPAAFIDDKGIWLFTGFLKKNTHCPCANADSWGIEQLGDFNVEGYVAGRGQTVRRNAIEVLAILSVANGFTPESLRLHREATCSPGHTDCPGTNCVNNRKQIIADLTARMKYWHDKWKTL